METQSSIALWGRETFGTYSALTMASRMNVETAELVSILTHQPDNWEEITAEQRALITEELADVFIVLVQVMEIRKRQDWQPKALVRNQFRYPHTLAADIALWSAQLIYEMRLSASTDGFAACHTAANLLGCLQAACACLDADLQQAVDAKMTINRSRQWRRTEAGRHQHA